MLFLKITKVNLNVSHKAVKFAANSSKIVIRDRTCRSYNEFECLRKRTDVETIFSGRNIAHMKQALRMSGGSFNFVVR